MEHRSWSSNTPAVVGSGDTARCADFELTVGVIGEEKPLGNGGGGDTAVKGFSLIANCGLSMTEWVSG